MLFQNVFTVNITEWVNYACSVWEDVQQLAPLVADLSYILTFIHKSPVEKF